MTPAARYSAAIDVLDAWRGGMPVEKALIRWSRGARYAGSKDRAAVRDHVFDVLRAKATCAALGGGQTGRDLVLGLLRANQIDPQTVFGAGPYGPPGLSEKESACLNHHRFVDAAHDVPAWLRPDIAARSNGQDQAFYKALQSRAPVYLRINLRKADVSQAQQVLARDNILCDFVPGAKAALIVQNGAARVARSQAYQDGLVEIQDLSVQLAVEAVDWPQKGKILDYCAGGGGKSLAIAAQSSARIYAHDVNPKRMSDIPARAARAGVGIDVIGPNSVQGIAPFDAVLCDVPCSGSGTWRRDPEAKWRLTSDRLADLTQTQDHILAQAAGYVRPGGVLVYMTCSLFAVENQARITAFLGHHARWNCMDTGQFDPLTASDGFYYAVLTKKGA
jgi:16S rRNA (cytosine967-C5)-methyltransferase